MGAPEHEDRDKKRPSALGPQYGVGAETAMEGTRRRDINRGAAETARGGGAAGTAKGGGGAGTAPPLDPATDDDGDDDEDGDVVVATTTASVPTCDDSLERSSGNRDVAVLDHDHVVAGGHRGVAELVPLRDLGAYQGNLRWAVHLDRQGTCSGVQRHHGELRCFA